MQQDIKKRIFLIVADSFGIGDAPDAERFGDKGANTLKSIMASKYFKADNLKSLGLFNIDGLFGGVDSPKGAYARLIEKSNGKDTTTGHWEIAGIVSDRPMPTYPNGFSDELLNELSKRTGRGIICNKTYSGTEVIRDYGDEHIKTGSLIVYTSADSVLQIAAHEDIVPLDTLYKYCEIAREISDVGRVIARPFTTVDGKYVRTANRRDFSLKPPKATMLDNLKERGFDTISVGKIYDIFAGRGISEYYLTHSNAEGMQKTAELVNTDFNGLCFVNLVDFDMLYGHRNDVDGYAKAIAEFDKFLGEFLPMLKATDMLIITADHGCDPGDISTDHTRECVPLLVYGAAPKNLGTITGFDYISNLIEENFK